MNKEYIKDFNFNSFLKVLLIVSIFFFCSDYFFRVINNVIVTPFNLADVKKSLKLDILVILTILGCCIYFIQQTIIKRNILAPTSLAIISVILLGYIFIIRLSKSIYLEPLFLNNEIKYLDIVFILFFTTIAHFKYYKNSRKSTLSTNGFIEDDFNPEVDDDILNQKKYAYEIALKILDTKSLNKAFVIAINSPWGFGKSGFVSIIEDFFKKKKADELRKILKFNNDDYSFSEIYSRHRDVIIVKYNPWKNFDEKTLIKSFFDELSSAFEPFDSQLAKNINEYASNLTKLDESVLKKIIETTIDTFNDTKTLNKIFVEINKSIERIQKRVIIFLDDFDRLTGDELIDILKLIRNTANFKNTFFVVAFDHNYVLNTISKKNLISNKEEYLQKIVQLEITLPIYSKNILLQFLSKKIDDSLILRKYTVDINNALTEINSISIKKNNSNNKENEIESFLFNLKNDTVLIFRILQNIRDVVRLVNSLKLSIELIAEAGDIYEIIMLELLKIKYLSIYQLISKKEFLIQERELYRFNEEEFEKFCIDKNCELLNIRPNDTIVINNLLRATFNSKRKVFFRSVRNVRYFDIYFTYQTPNIISLNRIDTAIKDNSIEDIISLTNQSISENSFDDFKAFFESQNTFVNHSDLEMILKSLFYIAIYDSNKTIVFQIKSILRNNEISNLYENQDRIFSDFLLSVLSDNKYDIVTRAEIAGDEVYKIANKNDSENFNDNSKIIINNKEKLLIILSQCLEEIISKENDYNELVYSVYVKNINNIAEGTRKISLSKRANEIMKTLLINRPENYLKKYFLRVHPEPTFEGRYYHFDPFLLEYFTNIESIVTFLNSNIVKNIFKTEDEKKYYQFILKKIKEPRPDIWEKFLVKSSEPIFKIIEKYFIDNKNPSLPITAKNISLNLS